MKCSGLLALRLGFGQKGGPNTLYLEPPVTIHVTLGFPVSCKPRLGDRREGVFLRAFSHSSFVFSRIRESVFFNISTVLMEWWLVGQEAGRAYLLDGHSMCNARPSSQGEGIL